jgi:hypothetical protein
VVAVLIGVVLGAAAAPAGAADELIVEVDGGGPIFQTSSFYPGAETSTTVRIRNAGLEAGELSVRSAGIVDEDHCSPAELRAGMPCGSGQGDLGEQIELSIALVGDGADQLVWKGSVYELEEGVVLADALPAGGEPVTYRFGAHLPVASGNETQMDALRFDVRFDLAGHGATQVAGMVLGNVGSSSGMSFLGIPLPVTGRPLAALAAGAGLLAASATVLTGSRLLRTT